jgi:DNA-binding winged helix-turn-helix (wHTH) protein
VRFGAFELDVRSGELRKSGVRVALQEQPFKILTRLLTRPGDLVTREQLRQELWPSETFVDFEHGLNAAIKRLRDALGDSAESPRFIETVPRRGYRFIASVAPTHPIGELPALVGWWRSQLPGTHRWWMAGLVTTALLVAISAWWLLTRNQTVPRFSGRGSEEPRATVRLTYDKGLTIEPAISPDGSLVAYSSDRSGEGNLDIWLRRTAGGIRFDSLVIQPTTGSPRFLRMEAPSPFARIAMAEASTLSRATAAEKRNSSRSKVAGLHFPRTAYG